MSAPRKALNKLFIEQLLDDFTEHGIQAIESVRVNDPTNYMKIVAALVPKELAIESTSTNRIYVGIEETAKFLGLLKDGEQPTPQEVETPKPH